MNIRGLKDVTFCNSILVLWSLKDYQNIYTLWSESYYNCLSNLRQIFWTMSFVQNILKTASHLYHYNVKKQFDNERTFCAYVERFFVITLVPKCLLTSSILTVHLFKTMCLYFTTHLFRIVVWHWNTFIRVIFSFEKNLLYNKHTTDLNQQSS